MRIFNLLLKIAQKQKKPFEYMGDVYWGSGAWTCPADGFINFRVASVSDAPYLLVYVKDTNMGLVVGSVSGVGKGSTAHSTFPVQKGHSYKTGYAYGHSSFKALYFKLGVVKIFKALQSHAMGVVA